MTESEEENLFREYLTSAGALVHADLALLADDENKGRKVILRADVAKGTELLRIPVNICFFAAATGPARENGQSEEQGGDLETYMRSQRKLTPFLCLVLSVLHEFSKGDASQRKTHLSVLPKSHNCVLGWKSNEKAALTGTAIEADAMTDIRATFNRIVQPVIAGQPELWPNEWASFEKFQLVCGLVQSRTFHLEENNWLTGAISQGADLYIIPGIDMVNHSTDPSARNTSLQRKQLPAKDGSGGDNGEDAEATASFFTLEAEVDIAAGSELLHTYGELSDGELLNTFGFVDTMGSAYKNPNNRVLVPTEALVAWCQEQKSGRRLGKNFKRRKDFLRELDMLPDGFPVTLSDPLPDSLITATQILLMSDMAEFDDLRLELQKLKKKKQSTDVLGKETLDESEHSMFVCTTLLRTIDEQISSMSEAAAPASEGGDPTRLAQAAHINNGEKEVVQTQRKEILKLMMSLNSDAEEDGQEEAEPEEY